MPIQNPGVYAVETAARVRSCDDFRAAFGGRPSDRVTFPHAFLADSVGGFFGNGGRDLPTSRPRSRGSMTSPTCRRPPVPTPIPMATAPGATMTQADIDGGRLVLEVGVAPLRQAEFVVLRFEPRCGAGA